VGSQVGIGRVSIGLGKACQFENEMLKVKNGLMKYSKSKIVYDFKK
jgi:hypothetical protein